MNILRGKKLRYPIRKRELRHCEKCGRSTDHEVVEYAPGVRAQQCRQCGKTSGDME